MRKNSIIKSETIAAPPVKEFFIKTMPRDIELKDAILDLLDNCVDGIERSINTQQKKEYNVYQNFNAEISLEGKKFKIKDNCGGIPYNILSDYALRMGRPSHAMALGHKSIGFYGIGMKRALFKMGEYIEIRTQHEGYTYRVLLDEEWLNNSEDWNINIDIMEEQMDEDGTSIEVSNLHDHIMQSFNNKAFIEELVKTINTQYAFIIKKGFSVYVNNVEAQPSFLALKFKENIKSNNRHYNITPFLWESKINNVDVKLAIGFYRELPTQKEIEDQQEGRKRTEHAGWTIVCNDRVVVYCDKTELTGWGDVGVPKYHTQFISISGIVFMYSDNPEELPLTTTKRGLDPTHPVYLQIKPMMIEGLKKFTSYTNQWKGRLDHERNLSRSDSYIEISNINKMFEQINDSEWKKTRKIPGYKYSPELPKPTEKSSLYKIIKFKKHVQDIQKVSDYLEIDTDKPNEVGEYCFDKTLYEAKNYEQ